MIDIPALKQRIIDNADDMIPEILEAIGCAKIKNKDKEFRCAKDEYSDPTAIVIKKGDLYTRCYSLNLKGDIFRLVQVLKGYGFKQSLEFVCRLLNITPEEKVETIEVFGGYYKKFKKYKDNNTTLETYPEEILNDYIKTSNKRFTEDGISIDIQEKFNIGYDLLTNRISVPWYSPLGEIIGVMGRTNSDEEYDMEYKWLPLMRFEKTKSLYGYSHNYYNMVNSTIIITESEKGVLQLASMNINKGVAVGCSSVSVNQKRLIYCLYPKKIILAFDEGLEEEHIKYEAKRLISNNVFSQTKVGYIYDKDNQILEKGSKKSPTDLGVKAFKELIKNHLSYV